MADTGKKIKHVGMRMTEEEHERWHKEHSELTPVEHEALMEKMGISKEQDEEWHEAHGMPEQPKRLSQKPINPYAVGGGFLEYCVKQGWMIREGKGRNARYYVTPEGEGKLRGFGITV